MKLRMDWRSTIRPLAEMPFLMHRNRNTMGHVSQVSLVFANFYRHFASLAPGWHRRCFYCLDRETLKEGLELPFIRPFDQLQPFVSIHGKKARQHERLKKAFQSDWEAAGRKALHKYAEANLVPTHLLDWIDEH